MLSSPWINIKSFITRVGGENFPKISSYEFTPIVAFANLEIFVANVITAITELKNNIEDLKQGVINTVQEKIEIKKSLTETLNKMNVEAWRST